MRRMKIIAAPSVLRAGHTRFSSLRCLLMSADEGERIQRPT